MPEISNKSNATHFFAWTVNNQSLTLDSFRQTGRALKLRDGGNTRRMGVHHMTFGRTLLPTKRRCVIFRKVSAGISRRNLARVQNCCYSTTSGCHSRETTCLALFCVSLCNLWNYIFIVTQIPLIGLATLFNYRTAVLFWNTSIPINQDKI